MCSRNLDGDATAGFRLPPSPHLIGGRLQIYGTYAPDHSYRVPIGTSVVVNVPFKNWSQPVASDASVLVLQDAVYFCDGSQEWPFLAKKQGSSQLTTGVAIGPDASAGLQVTITVV